LNKGKSSPKGELFDVGRGLLVRVKKWGGQVTFDRTLSVSPVDCHLALLTKGEAREILHGFKAVSQASQAVRAVLQGEENRSCRNNFAEIR